MLWPKGQGYNLHWGKFLFYQKNASCLLLIMTVNATQLYPLHQTWNQTTTQLKYTSAPFFFFFYMIYQAKKKRWHPVCEAGFGWWSDTENGPSNPNHAKKKISRGYHKYIEIKLNGASSGVHVLALHKWTYVSLKETEHKKAEVSRSPASVSHLYTIQWQELARDPDKCPFHIWH